MRFEPVDIPLLPSGLNVGSQKAGGARKQGGFQTRPSRLGS
jgi:hypothetical protein